MLQSHAHELLGHEEVQQMLDRLAQSAPKLVEDLVPQRLPLGVVVKVLQNLLAARVPIRNIRTIVASLAEHAGGSQAPAALTTAARATVGGQFVTKPRRAETRTDGK